MNMNIVKKNFLLVCVGVCLLISASGNLLAQEGELGDESWTVEQRIGRYFYFTHGAAVWGHEFGFFKDPNDCTVDTFWITFSSSEEKVKNFQGKGTVISLNVDGKDFRINAPVLGVGTIGLTYVMTFTNVEVEGQLMDALRKGRHVKVMILEPEELEVLLDIKQDEFGLEGMPAARKQATANCQEDRKRERENGAEGEA